MQWKNETASEQFSNQNKSTWFRSHLPHHYITINTPADIHTATHTVHVFISAVVALELFCEHKHPGIPETTINTLRSLRSAMYSATLGQGRKEGKIKIQRLLA